MQTRLSNLHEKPAAACCLPTPIDKAEGFCRTAQQAPLVQAHFVRLKKHSAKLKHHAKAKHLSGIGHSQLQIEEYQGLRNPIFCRSPGSCMLQQHALQ